MRQRKCYFSVLLTLLLINASLVRAEGSNEDDDDSDSLFGEDCCLDGEEWVSAGCSPPADFKRSQECVESAKACCSKILSKNKECAQGIEMGKQSQDCAEAKGNVGSCCEQCKLGILLASSESNGCGDPKEGGVYTCCKFYEEQLAAQTTEKTTSTTTPKPTSTTQKVTPQYDGCELGGATMCAQKCVPRGLEYDCMCRPGFILRADKHSCQRSQPNRCLRKNPCQHHCTDTGVGVMCTCRRGFELMTDKKSCIDLDECELQLHKCKAGTRCENTEGSFRCVPEGDASPQSPPVASKPRSRCPKGYAFNDTLKVCDDIDECKSNPCPNNRTCINSLGSYSCGPPGAPGASRPSPRHEETCPPGFKMNTQIEECADIDECVENTDDCNRKSQFCLNTHGSFTCQDKASKTSCPPGFKMSPTFSCEDIDECADSDACSPDTECVNEPGGYDCKARRPGSPPAAARPAARPRNPRPPVPAPAPPPSSTPNTPAACPIGYRRAYNGGCSDIDECSEKSHSCDDYQDCINTMGSHRCNCKEGFRRDPITRACTDVNECQMSGLNDCSESERCDNTIGSYHCTRMTSCGTGYTLNAASGTCEDNDECLLNSHDCHLPLYECLNMLGSYRCVRVVPLTTSTSTPAPEYDGSPEYYYTDEDEKPEDVKPEIEPPRVLPSQQQPRQPTNTIEQPIEPRMGGPDKNEDAIPPPPPPLPPRPTEQTEPGQEEPRMTEVPKPNNELTFVNRPNEDGDVVVNTKEVPKNTWTKLIPGEKQCIAGYTMDAKQECVDVDECRGGDHSCNPDGEICRNTLGGYICVCGPGYLKDPRTGKCRAPLPAKPTEAVPRWLPPPRKTCDIGFFVDPTTSECIDVDECEEDSSRCAANEDCDNTPGGFRCQCSSGYILIGERCQPRRPPTPPPRPPPRRPPPVRIVPVRPTPPKAYCRWGFRLNEHNHCVDVDECAEGQHTCQIDQQCINDQGGYQCRCPAGHRSTGRGGCEDVNECSETFGKVCSQYATCVNTIGSYRCNCRAGFMAAVGSQQLCTDIDECEKNDGRGLCHQRCVNVWGSYRCTCDLGYRLRDDNTTCIDVDECAVPNRRLCVGDCQNTPGSYACVCPKGYRMGQDKRSCIDIDECESGELTCGTDEVCQNTRGGARCSSVACPSGYHREQGSKHRCRRIHNFCALNDNSCLQKPDTYSFNFITFVSRLYIPTEPKPQVDLFTMRGPNWLGAMLHFELHFVEARAAPGVQKATVDCFRLDQFSQQALVSLKTPLMGPQDIHLELSMKLFTYGKFEGTAVAKIFIYVSEYEF